jgi:hypothetical protein
MKFGGGEGHTPPFSNSHPLLTSHRKNAEHEQEHGHLQERQKDQHQRWHITRGGAKVGISCSLQVIESVKQQVLKKW